MSDQELEQSTEEIGVESLEEAIEELKDKIQTFLDDPRVKVATVVFSVTNEESPHVLRKGHFYNNAVLLNTTLDAYRAKAAVELGMVGPR